MGLCSGHEKPNNLNSENILFQQWRKCGCEMYDVSVFKHLRHFQGSVLLL